MITFRMCIGYILALIQRKYHMLLETVNYSSLSSGTALRPTPEEKVL